MAFSTEELASIVNSTLDYYEKNDGSPFYQTIQERPLLRALEPRAKTFPGGKGDISLAVKGAFGMPLDATGTPAPVPAAGSDAVTGYTHDDTVKFYTPANIQRAEFPWREHHLGLTMTHTELKHDGISVTDTNGAGTSSHSRREMTALVDLLEDKLFDFAEQYARGMNTLAWGDGTGDAKAMAGIQHLVVEDPTAGVAGGLDREDYPWWRNYAMTAAHALAGGDDAVTSSPTNGGALAQALQKLWRQLTRYGGKPSHIFAGSDWINALEVEYRANGYYSDSGFTGAQDMSVGDLRFKGLPVVYDPTLDDLSLPKRAYILDLNAIRLYKMEGEWRKRHTPSRPPEKMVMYRSITSTGQMVANRMNSSAVVDIA